MKCEKLSEGHEISIAFLNVFDMLTWTKIEQYLPGLKFSTFCKSEIVFVFKMLAGSGNYSALSLDEFKDFLKNF